KLDDEGHVAVYGIHFDFDKADLKVGSEKALTEIIKLMKADPGLRVEIQGHTDNVGGREYNLDLSKRRAQTVRDYLSLYGIESSRMTLAGYGFGMPVASNDTEEGRALNRRVELKKL
ncbi:MAG: OmpA family protein, partial [Thermodesulfobacteriota bacterium]